MSDKDFKYYIKIWEKIKEDLDEDLAEFFSNKDKSGYSYFLLLNDTGQPTKLQIIRLLRKIIKKLK